MLTAALAVAVAVSLAGCSDGGSPETDDSAGQGSTSLFERVITLTDGRTVTCVIYSSYQRGGVSCDFGGAR
jgi:hypothetical protein